MTIDEHVMQFFNNLSQNDIITFDKILKSNNFLASLSVIHSCR